MFMDNFLDQRGSPDYPSRDFAEYTSCLMCIFSVFSVKIYVCVREVIRSAMKRPMKRFNTLMLITNLKLSRIILSECIS